MWYGGWPKYVPVAQRRARAKKSLSALSKRGGQIQPVELQGRKIADTFWGKAWCDHLESFSDYANRLPRGRSYVRNGSVCHLKISSGEIAAKVAGSRLYNLKISVKPLAKAKWTSIKQNCRGQIGSLLELLQGKLSGQVMDVVADRKQGLFPQPHEIKLECDCPDWAVMCKHVAATLYGVGARLDTQPELLFTLRGVNHEDLIAADALASAEALTDSTAGRSNRLAEDDLAAIFDVDLSPKARTPQKSKAEKKKPAAAKPKVKIIRRAAKKPSGKKAPATGSNTKKPAAKRAAKTTKRRKLPR